LGKKFPLLGKLNFGGEWKTGIGLRLSREVERYSPFYWKIPIITNLKDAKISKRS